MPLPLVSRLTPFLSSPNERVGLILADGSLVELRNISERSAESFLVDPAELLAHEDQMVGTWHTHPRTPATLSGDDYQTFLMWPDLLHVIVGTDGVRGYLVAKGAVVNDASYDHPTWHLEEADPSGVPV